MNQMNQMMKQAQALQKKMQEAQEKIQQTEMVGTSGAGMVSVTINGKNEMKALKIDPSLIDKDEAEVLEDLIVAAFNDAKGKIDDFSQKEMSQITGGLGGLGGLPF